MLFLNSSRLGSPSEQNTCSKLAKACFSAPAGMSVTSDRSETAMEPLWRITEIFGEGEVMEIILGQNPAFLVLDVSVILLNR